MKKAFTIEKKIIAQVRYYETLYLVRDANGERIYTGSEESAKRVERALNAHGRRVAQVKRLRKKAVKSRR